MNRNIDVCKIESKLISSARMYLLRQGYTEVLVPHLTTATGSCENMDTLFSLDYFGKEVFLSQTGQLYLETLVDKYKKVYCLSPSFRAEPRVDSRHLTEFPLLEIELDCTFNNLLLEIEGIFRAMFSSLKKEFTHLRDPPYYRVKYETAIDILKLEWLDDISIEDEQKLIKRYDRPVFITHYPIEMKFFNMKKNNKDNRIVNSADLIVPYGGECVGAAEREYEYKSLIDRLVTSLMFEQLNKRGKGIEEFQWYLDYYKQPRIIHSGCGIGLSRIIQYILKENDIRKCVTYPLNREIIW